MTATMAESESGLAARLRALRAGQPALTAAALATRAGLLLAADTNDETDADSLAALGADLLASADTTARALAGGSVREATTRGPAAHVIALAAGENTVLIAMTDVLTPASSVLPDLREAAGELAEGL